MDDSEESRFRTMSERLTGRLSGKSSQREMNCPAKYMVLSEAAGVEGDQQIVSYKGFLQWEESWSSSGPLNSDSNLKDPTSQVKTLKNIRWIKQSINKEAINE